MDLVVANSCSIPNKFYIYLLCFLNFYDMCFNFYTLNIHILASHCQPFLSAKCLGMLIKRNKCVLLEYNYQLH